MMCQFELKQVYEQSKHLTEPELCYILKRELTITQLDVSLFTLLSTRRHGWSSNFPY